ncbi:MAG: tetratricopeptide repeat protein [Candidatus Melainabacteria bacterium]|nr:tetratricopeptide repeat protein [Candidatus Melainabacteria bacterium]
MPSASGQPPNDPETQLTQHLTTLSSHRWFVLIGCSFFIFECIFLTLYGSDFWFTTDISCWGIPTIVCTLTLSHFLLTWVESPQGCRFFYPIWKGRPPLVYSKWITLNESGITFGTRHIVWAAINSLSLTFFGNLEVRSRSICGPDAPYDDVVLKFPFGPAPPASQALLLRSIKTKVPGVSFNKKLLKHGMHQIRWTQLVQSLGVIFMLFILADVGSSTFSYLQMMKEYYLAQSDARAGNHRQAQTHLASAERLRQHPFPLSWVTTKLLAKGTVAARVEESLSEALWYLGAKNQALEASRKALELHPTGFRLNLRLARMLIEIGRFKEARTQIQQAIENHEGSLLPRLYMLSWLKQDNALTSATRFYHLYLDELDELVFGQEPMWPPGGNRYLHEILYRDDVTFILDRLLHNGSSRHL